MWIFFIFIVGIINCTYGIHSVGEEEYGVLVLLVKREFNVPVKERTKIQKNAVIKFWRSKEKFTIGEGGILLYEGKKVLIYFTCL